MFACGCVFVCRLIWCLFSVLFKLFGLLFVSVVFVFVGRVFVSGLFVSAFCMFVCALDFAFLFLLSLWFCYISVGFNFFQFVNYYVSGMCVFVLPFIISGFPWKYEEKHNNDAMGTEGCTLMKSSIATPSRTERDMKKGYPKRKYENT